MPKRTDANQAEIVSFLRALGATVHSLHMVGDGCPDLVVGWQGRNVLMEIKDGTKPLSARSLTAEQAIWHNEWRGQVAIVRNCEEAVAVLNKTGRGR